VTDTYRAFEGQTHRRFPKTHLPIDGLPIYSEVQYIHVARDGRDAALSMHNHFTGFSKEKLKQFDEMDSRTKLFASHIHAFQATLPNIFDSG
jgi:Sulfotransferase domain